jgi:hypothetical protein
MKTILSQFRSQKKDVKYLTLPQRIFKISSILTIGIVYWNRDYILKILDRMYGNYFQYYHDKNTNLKKMVRENVDIDKFTEVSFK